MLNKVKVFSEMIKFKHTVFALPFAYTATFLAEGKILLDRNFIWITLAMVGARTTAMMLNRLIDRLIDAQNPRTNSRALPKGKLKVAEAWLYTVLFAFLFFFSASQLSPLAFTVAPVCLLSFFVYPYTKRFTWLSHFFLGFTIGMAPLAAWLAITNSISAGVLFLSLGVAFWIAGFDIIYACDDFSYDRETGLFSIPARFGIDSALKISSFVHVAAMTFFLLTGFALQLGISYWSGLLLAVFLLYKQHSLLSPQNLSRLQFAFFNLNGTLSVTLFVAALLDIGMQK